MTWNSPIRDPCPQEFMGQLPETNTHEELNYIAHKRMFLYFTILNYLSQRNDGPLVTGTLKVRRKLSTRPGQGGFETRS